MEERYMESTISVPATVTARHAPRFLAGMGNIFNKELREWFRTKRFIVTTILTTLLLAAAPVIVWLNKGGLSKGRLGGDGRTYLDLLDAWVGLGLTLGAYLVVVVTMNIMVKEQESGTAQWLFTKPASRVGYVIAKWGANTVAVFFASVLIPSIISLGLTYYLFDITSWSRLAIAILLMGLVRSTIIAFVIVLSAFFSSTALIGGICFLLNFAPFILGAVLSDKWMGLFPLWTGDFLSNYVQGVPMSEFDRVDYEPIFFSILYIPICLAIAGWRMRRKQMQ
jgi:ABC-type transport system involved in multi-copper enzyme maturation permease subunit